MKFNISSILNFFYEVGTLRHATRAYTTKVLVQTESIADHSHRAAIIAYMLAQMAGANPEKTALMSLFHDIPETRTGDLDWVQKQYVTVDEDKAISAQLSPLGDLSTGILALLHEYHERETLESKLAKDADNLEYNMSLMELSFTGNEEAKTRLQDTEHQFGKIYTDEAREILREMFNSSPNQWIRADIKKTREKYKVN